jgi:hypothetical protein
MINIPIKQIYDLNSWGLTVLYLPDYDIFLLPNEFIPSQCNNNIDYINVTGKDITNMIKNHESNILSFDSFAQKIAKIPWVKITLDKNSRFIRFQPGN